MGRNKIDIRDVPMGTIIDAVEKSLVGADFPPAPGAYYTFTYKTGRGVKMPGRIGTTKGLQVRCTLILQGPEIDKLIALKAAREAEQE